MPSIELTATWRIGDDPSALSVRLDTPVEAFTLYLPFPKYKCDTYVARTFDGGTLADLFRLIYKFYQEGISRMDVLNALRSHNLEERQMLTRHYDSVTSGRPVSRLEMDWSTDGAFGGIQDSILILTK
jgi:hypothetical protein